MNKSTFSSDILMIEFPGSNCDNDCERAFHLAYGVKLRRVWHGESILPPAAGVLLPGGFSYGDYLRAGHLASCSPLMGEIINYAKKGGPILGICNGFQILTESCLLPGVLLTNQSGKFSCQRVNLSSVEGQSIYHQSLQNSSLSLPIAHKQGRYFIDDDGLKKLKDHQQILLTYQKNPNGSVADIAGVCSENGRILGLMPHPERAVDSVLPEGEDGKKILGSFLSLCL